MNKLFKKISILGITSLISIGSMHLNCYAMETATPTVKIEDNDTNTGIGILYQKTFTKKFNCGQTKVTSTFYFNECYASVGVVTSDSCEIEISGYAEDYAYVKHSLYGHGDNVTTCSAGARNHSGNWGMHIIESDIFVASSTGHVTRHVHAEPRMSGDIVLIS